MPPSQSRWIVPCLFLLIALLNALLIRDLFGIVYPQSMFSIEAAYVSLARAYQEHGLSMTWFPYWYGGLPMVSTYPPLLHLIVAAVASTAPLDPAHAYHIVTAITYSLIPSAVFFSFWVFSRRPYAGAVAAALTTILSPTLLVFPEARAFVGGAFYPRRLHALFTFGEGPHVSSLLLMLLAMVAFHRALERRTARWFALAAVLLGATVLTNTLGASALAFAVLAYLGTRRDVLQWRTWVRVAALGIAAYLLAAPLFPPSTILAVRTNAPFVGGVFQGSILTYSLLGLLLLFGFALGRFLAAFGVERLAQWTASVCVPLLGISVSGQFYGLPLLPQPERYHLVLEIFLIMAAVALVAPLYERYQSRRAFIVPSSLVLVALIVMQVRNTREWVYQHVHGGDVTQTIEYQTAQWLSANLPGARVFVPGSISFWLYAFASQPQVGGGYDNGVANPNYLGVSYQILSGEGAGEREAEVAITWLKAYGARAVQVSYPDSAEVFHPFRNPGKFDGVLEELWRHRGTRIYRVPAPGPGLAYVIPEQAVPTARPRDGLDTKQAETYVRALEDSTAPETKWQWLSPTEAEIRATTERGQVVSVQVSDHPGWEAFDQHGAIAVEGDALGQIVLRPRPGPQVMRLVFTGSMEAKVLRVLSALTAAALLLLMAAEIRSMVAARKRTAPAS